MDLQQFTLNKIVSGNTDLDFIFKSVLPKYNDYIIPILYNHCKTDNDYETIAKIQVKVVNLQSNLIVKYS